jgi:hypothetical protein
MKPAKKADVTTPRIDALRFADALCDAKYGAAATWIAVQGVSIENRQDIRFAALAKLAVDNLEHLEALQEDYERIRKTIPVGGAK